MNRPVWWDWPLELSPHLLKRMVDRGFSETELRQVIEQAEKATAQADGRFRIEATLHRRRWAVIVEPDHDEEKTVVVTAYPVTAIKS